MGFHGVWSRNTPGTPAGSYDTLLGGLHTSPALVSDAGRGWLAEEFRFVQAPPNRWSFGTYRGAPR
jgi:hypothetical protein